MELEFDCGTVAQNVGVPIMAMRYHTTVCTNEACIADVKSEISKHEKSGKADISWS